MGAIFVATFTAVAVSAAQDLFAITAPANSRVAIREIRFGQYSDPGDAQAEMLSVQVIRGYTAIGSGGTSATPVNIQGHAGAVASSTLVDVNDTTVASTGTPVVLCADTLNVMAGWRFYPVPDERPIITNNAVLVVRITAPADAITMNGTIVFEELGYGSAA